MSKYWIKLYHEILDDPKMGKLSEHLFKRTIELFLLAGEYNEEGALPPIDDMAWRLRTDIDILRSDLKELQSCNIVTYIDGLWIVTKFSERQRASTEAERVARYRERKRKTELIVTKSNTNVTDNVTMSVTNTVLDKDKDKDKDKRLSSPNGDGAHPEPVKSEFITAMEHLESTFAEARGSPLPDWVKDPKGSNKRWRTPLGQIYTRCGKDKDQAARLIKQVVTRMMREGLTFDAPDQILKTSLSVIIDQDRPSSNAIAAETY